MSLFPSNVTLRIVETIRQANKAPVLVGIDGLGGAGKSTLAREIADGLDRSVAVIEGDDFYSDMPAPERAALTPQEGAEMYFDWERLRREVLLPVSTGADTLRYQQYDWGGERMGTWVELLIPEVLIVEGVYTLRRELSDLIDVSIYVDADENVRRTRQMDRGQNSHEWIARWMAAEDYYVATREPRTVADVVVEG